MAGVSSRKKKFLPIDVDEPSKKYNKGVEKYTYIAEEWLSSPLPDLQSRYDTLLYVVTGIAFIARFYKIWYPKEVVFDEVHFGKFASYYLERTYFFDVHPPFAKMLIAFVGGYVVMTEHSNLTI